jgi:hypothetical protein
MIYILLLRVTFNALSLSYIIYLLIGKGHLRNPA